MASIQASRFALLNIDDDNSDDDQKKGKQGSKGKQTQNQNKKKNKKKKPEKTSQQKENEELRSLAFAKGGKTQGTAGVGISVICAKEPSSDKQWKEWQEVDQEFTSETYEKDLQQAILQSKLEAEKSKKLKPVPKEDDGLTPKQKKKKEKAKKTMSLDEFRQEGTEKSKPETNGSGDVLDDIQVPDDPKFFKDVEADAHKIIQREQIQEQYQKQFVVENARTQHYEEKIRSRNEKIEKLRAENTKLETELKEVKERNQQLCMILAQGEMKQMANVVMELNQMKQVRDELTQEVSNLTTELEKERSKVHALQPGSDKTKGNKRK